jgi:hypothetical protein
MVTQQISDDAAAGTRARPGRIDSELQEHIGRQLREVYNQIVEEPIPERFVKLLEELRTRQGRDS